MKPVITRRLAHPHEGPLVRELLQKNAGEAWNWMNWETISPNWLIAEHNGIPCGCIMFSPGVPVARVDMLSIDPSLSRRIKAIVARDLVYDAWGRCAEMGAQAIMMMIEWSVENQWMTIAMRREAIPYAEGVFLVKPVQRGSYVHRISR